MKFYHIKDDYISFLREFDKKVSENKQEGRPYVGTLIQMGDVGYYAPFTSPKKKHLQMKNGKDFRKIDQGKLGAINFNNMIPVANTALMLIDIDHEPDLQYRRLLQNQYKAIKADFSAIVQTAKALRKIVLTEDDQLTAYDRRVKERCCNLKLLESIYIQYNKNNMI